MDKLPRDLNLNISIAKLVADQAKNPLDDLTSLRFTNQELLNTVGSAEVGRSIALDRVLGRRTPWEPYYRPAFCDKLTRSLAHTGNPLACTLEGLRVLFIKERSNYNPPLELLDRAAMAAISFARYVLVLFIYRANSWDEHDAKAKNLLRSIESDGACHKEVWTNKECSQALLDAFDIIHNLKPREDEPKELGHAVKPVRGSSSNPCGAPWCGAVMDYQRWEKWHKFCSENCRIEHESQRFFSHLW